MQSFKTFMGLTRKLENIQKNHNFSKKEQNITGHKEL